MRLATIRRLAPVAALAVAGLTVPAGAQNVALGKDAFGSSVWSPLRTPDRAVDGNTQGSYNPAPYVFHSNAGALEWWFVDLGQSYDISEIRFFNRTDCCETRINGATIGVWESLPFTAATTVGSIATPEWSAVFAGVTTTADLTQRVDFSPAGASGRYVGIWHSREYLQIAEVEVYGVATNVSAVPEPSTWALLGSGLLALGGIARRRRG